MKQNGHPDQITQQVTVIISEALRVDAAKVHPGSSLIKDLGAESIDFLDIVFRLEKAFKIKIPKGELFPEKLLTDARYVKDGRITTAGLEELKRKSPTGHWEEFSKDPLVSNLGNIFTVAMIVHYLNDKLATADK